MVPRLRPAAAGPNKWRTPDDANRGAGLIGPNAILQLLPVLERAGGQPLRDQVMAAAGVFAPPSDEGMMPEGPAARMHQALRAIEPEMAPSLAWAAGERTARYIMARRIPKPAQLLLRVLPAALAGPVLSKAIAQHAWTFAGSGEFAVTGPLVFEIRDNPIVRGEVSETPLCHWHAAVFETLFRSLVDPRLRCVEESCCATGAPACRFVLNRG
ncbi:divinyl protochlorophyllide a 8-vinyl-reductase [Loktanella sp. PT4BL]|jgi:divinyl protochlorophyllide a 8-vinyl-reductase|uniref:bacteriochlorophyll 4-vinyl reductase n=1 Tax=Loktanella sp. PT4BL TaxID=2135611 RepID=UPI000D7615D7|nr:bacteriochlorophyll 4-vinyl reductase [Loktanella sp. PT4BL]PXW72773.1 divinyl protochlorophyllide a 8-vinyl-reductase [Loktanella sp. PT4BL]